jgi:hypothetical protein
LCGVVLETGGIGERRRGAANTRNSFHESSFQYHRIPIHIRRRAEEREEREERRERGGREEREGGEGERREEEDFCINT